VEPLLPLGRPRTLTFKASESAIEGSLTAKLFQPYFIDRKNSLTITGAFDKEIATSYTLEKLSSQLQVKRNFENNLAIFTAYNAEVDKTGAVERRPAVGYPRGDPWFIIFYLQPVLRP